MNRLVSLRRLAADRQSHCCYYCGLPMWEREPTAFAHTYQLTGRQARLLKCTAEHLHPRSEGGPDSGPNIVAACLYCNRQRHAVRKPRSASEHKRFVETRMRRGRWLASLVPTLVAPGVMPSFICPDTPNVQLHIPSI